jgi:uncharacterized protein (DUF983 family)
MQHFNGTGSTTADTATRGVPSRSIWQAMLRGWRGRCPACGEGKLFGAFLKPVHTCDQCSSEMHHQRADDLPPYLVIFIVGHIVVAGYLIGERLVDLNSWQHLAIWVPVTIGLSFAMMQPLKGAVIGLQWALRLDGFGDPGRHAVPAHEKHTD